MDLAISTGAQGLMWAIPGGISFLSNSGCSGYDM